MGETAEVVAPRVAEVPMVEQEVVRRLPRLFWLQVARSITSSALPSLRATPQSSF